MFTWLNDLLANTSHFMPHGACYLWLPSLLWLHVISDGIIAFSYYSIPFALFYFVKKRTDLAYRWVFVLFGIFICLCGTTHLISTWTIWYPHYWLDGWVKAVTALVSVITALLIWPLIPALLKLPSPQTAQTSEAYLHAIFDATPDAILISNEQGIITMVNQQTEQLLGYTSDELLGQQIEILVPERYREHHVSFRKQFATEDITRRMGAGRTVKAVRKNGSEFDVEVSLSTIKTEQGLFFASALRDMTERNQAEAMLRVSESRFRYMANSSAAMIWITDTIGKPIFVNQSWMDFTGLTGPEMLDHKRWINSIHPNDRKETFNEYYRNTQEQRVITTEYRFRNAKGEWRWILDKGTPLYDENGKFNGYIGSAIDITERKEVQQAIQDKERMLSESQRIAHIGSWSIDIATNKISWSDEMYRICGVSPETFANTKEAFFELVHPDDLDNVVAWFDQCLAEQSPKGLDFRLMLANGDIRFVHSNGGLQYDKFKKPHHIVGSVQDITERKLAEGLSSKLKAMIDISLDGFGVIDSKGYFLKVNDAYAKMSGYSVQELVGKNISDLDAIYTPKQINKRTEQIIQQNHYELFETRHRHKDGHVFDVEVSVAFLPEFQHFCAFFRDISERKRAELALRESEELLRTITDNGNTVMFLKDVSGRYLHINRQYETLFHISNSTMQGKTDYDIFPKEIADNLVKNDQMVIQTETLSEIEEIVPQDDGDHIYLSVKFPIRNIEGEIYAVCGVSTDITERKHIEQELQIAAVAFQSQEPIVITDKTGMILRINQAFTASTGYTEAEAIGQKISILKSGRHDKAFYNKMWEKILKTGCWQGEIWDRRKNGEIYPKWLSITAVKNKSGIVTHYVGTHTDITERKSAEEQIKQLAFYDPLTKLPNRRLLQERLQHSIHIDERKNKKFALLMLDLDRFKAVNDSFGHLAGDELLQQVAERISALLRRSDTVARLGGDEFIILLEDISHADDAARIAKEVIIELSRPFKLKQSDDIRIGTSIGISLYPDHGVLIETLMDYADAALYQAKAQGRGCFAYFSEELTIAAKERMTVETQLRRAIEQQELRVFFQPQVDMSTGRIIGAEALVRWQHPTDGLISPIHFIPIAEETGLISEIGYWVLYETCWQGRQWLDQGLPPLTLAVNVSPQQFRDSNICALVATVLVETGFPAELLELEITETGLMENQENATAILNNLRNQGIRLAIDDFGTGYSSLSYLKHFPLDVLKIDKSFIDDIPFQQDDMEIASTIIAMGHILGFKVLAEGVETTEQQDFLQKKGCDMYQGYIKSRPMPSDEFFKLLQQQKSI